MNNLNDFISKIFNDIDTLYNKNSEKLLIFDIIAIYNQNYYTYEEYFNRMTMINDYIKKKNNMFTTINFTVNYIIEPLHTIIEKETYDYILELRKQNEEVK